MTDDRLESLRKRLSERQEAASRKLDDNINARLGRLHPQQSSLISDQTALQAASMLTDDQTGGDPVGALGFHGNDNAPATDAPPAPTGSWRCIVHSRWVNIDLTANISEDGSLTAQGTLIYEVTYKTFNVSGGGNWVALPPGQEAPNWLFQFRLIPSNHAIFSWFAAPTDSPNHLHNRFVNPETGSVVETRCERIG